MHSATPFMFKAKDYVVNIQESCWINGRPYFTRRAIGEWLEYKHPRRSINTIIERNPHINDSEWSVDIKMMSTDGKFYNTRVYDPIALQLIINKSNQPKAIAFQIAVAHLVAAITTGNLKPSKWTKKGDLVSAARQILSLPTGRKRGDLIRDLAKQEGCSIATAYRRINYATGKRLRQSIRSDKGTKNQMTGNRITAAILLFSAIIAADSMFESYLNYRRDVQIAEINKEINLKVIKLTSRLEYILQKYDIP